MSSPQKKSLLLLVEPIVADIITCVHASEYLIMLTRLMVQSTVTFRHRLSVSSAVILELCYAWLPHYVGNRGQKMCLVSHHNTWEGNS